jgi:NAD(P)-dependent dehydrogenase (short-subunit alcohol dehydrogenase family)
MTTQPDSSGWPPPPTPAEADADRDDNSMTSAGRLESLVAVVTGGASGIGRATVEAMARQGARVVVADRDTATGAEVAADIRGEGGLAQPVPVDIADEASVAAMVEQVVGAWGTIDVLVNAAAITDRAHLARDTTVIDIDLDHWNRTLAVDLSGTMLVCKHVVPLMVAQGSGSIVNVSSNSSLGGDLGLSGYAAAKAGVNSLTRSIATAFGKSGIRCNTVSPAAIEGPTFAAGVPPPLIEAMRANCLLPFLGAPADVAAAIVFLASDEARFVTGQLLCVDGGLLSSLPHVADLRRMGFASAVPEGTDDPPRG